MPKPSPIQVTGLAVWMDWLRNEDPNKLTIKEYWRDHSLREALTTESTFLTKPKHLHLLSDGKNFMPVCHVIHVKGTTGAYQ